jgi:hypothetical protein
MEVVLSAKKNTNLSPHSKDAGVPEVYSAKFADYEVGKAYFEKECRISGIGLSVNLQFSKTYQRIQSRLG